MLQQDSFSGNNQWRQGQEAIQAHQWRQLYGFDIWEEQKYIDIYG